MSKDTPQPGDQPQKIQKNPGEVLKEMLANRGHQPIIRQQKLPEKEVLMLEASMQPLEPYRVDCENYRKGDTSYQGFAPVFDSDYRQVLGEWVSQSINAHRATEDTNELIFKRTQLTSTESSKVRAQQDAISKEKSLTPEGQLLNILLPLKEEALQVAESLDKDGFIRDLDDAHLAQVSTAVHKALRAAEQSDTPEVRNALLMLALFPPKPLQKSSKGNPKYYNFVVINDIMAAAHHMFAGYAEAHLKRMREHIHDVIPQPVDHSSYGQEFAGLPTSLIALYAARSSSAMIPTNFFTFMSRGVVPKLPPEMFDLVVEQQEQLFFSHKGSDRYAKLTDAEGGHPYALLDRSYKNPADPASLLLMDANVEKYGMLTQEETRKELEHIPMVAMAQAMKQRFGNTFTLPQIAELDGDILVSAHASRVPTQKNEPAIIDLLLRRGNDSAIITVSSDTLFGGLPLAFSQVPTGFVIDSLKRLQEVLFSQKKSEKPTYAVTGGRRTGPASLPSKRLEQATKSEVTINTGFLYDKKSGLTPEQRRDITKQLGSGKVMESRIQTRIVGEGDQQREEQYIPLQGTELIVTPIKGKMGEYRILECRTSQVEE